MTIDERLEKLTKVVNALLLRVMVRKTYIDSLVGPLEGDHDNRRKA